MLRSFLTVGSGYVLMLVCVFGSLFLIGTLFFPEFNEFLKLNEADQLRMMDEDPQQAIPLAMFWSLVGLNLLTSFGVGWYVARTAPFAPFPHAVFLAVLIFVYFLQIVIADPPAKKWMDIIYMGAFPIAILWGAKWTLERAYRRGTDPVSDDFGESA